MWVSKRKWNDLQKKVTALEEEQLFIKKLIKQNVELDEQLIIKVKELREELGRLEFVYADIAKQPTQRS